MGVRGLATYIDKNQNVLQDFDLRDSPLVIDGNNLYYALYHGLKTGHASNGDYHIFAKAIRKFFQHLRECDIVPYVVLDGAYEPDDRKMKTVRDRLREKLHQASLISKGYVSCKIMPVLGHETFLSALKDLSIAHCMSDFEADEAMVALANDLSAPILSNDSDFFIFPLNNGFCRLDYFDHQHVRTDGEGQKFIRTKIYDMPTFCGHHPGLSPPLLPLFATLIGNDFVDATAFDNFFLHVNKPKFKRGSKGLKGNRRHCKMEGLLHWLQCVKSVEDGLELLLPHMKKEHHPRLRQILQKGILGYATFPAQRLIDFFQGENSVDGCSLVNKGGDQWPKPLWRSLRGAELAPQLLNMFVNRRGFLSFQIEDMEEEEAATVAQPIRNQLYSLILSLTPESSANQEIEEYGRLNSRLFHHPVTVVPSSTSLLDWISGRTVEERRHFLVTEVCNITSPDANDFLLNPKTRSYFSLFYLSIIFTFADSRCGLTRLDLAALIVTHAHSVLTLFRSFGGYRDVLNRRRDIIESEGEESTTSCELVSSLQSASPVELTSIKERLTRYVADKFRNKLRLGFVHGTAQWQAVFQTLCWLNRILLNPFVNPDPALLYDGTLAATLNADLKQRSDWRKFVEEELFRGTEIGRMTLALFDLVAPFCGRIKEEGEVLSEGKKKKKRRKEKTPIIEMEESEGTHSAEELEAAEAENCWFDENNKFSRLCLPVID